MFEINLVPDVKTQMLKTIKIKNLILFICIVVSAGAAGVVLLLSGISGGQSLIIGGQDKRIEEMSSKVMNYKGLNEFLTIQDQLSKISTIGENKKVLSRVFNVLGTFLPKNKDQVSFSELRVDLATSTLNFEGQADAKETPLIDYRVLESFKKGVQLTRYDYGRYVDKENREIPTRCIKETDEKGNAYTSENGSIFAYWKRGVRGCDPGRDDYKEEDEKNKEDDTKSKTKNKKDEVVDEAIEDVKIWRTPQFNEWYKKKYMDLSGQIREVPHFESQCIKYVGSEDGKKVKWTANNNCKVAVQDMVVRDSSNGRNAAGLLVLRFSATLEIDPMVFAFKNKHMMTIGPFEQNVTDSYMQIENMFSERAKDCAPGDTTCSTNTQNTGGNNG